MPHLTRGSLSIAAIILAAVAFLPAARAQKLGDPAEAKNMRLVGFNDLQGRSAYQPTIHHQGDRTIAYIGHHGASYVDKPVNALNGQREFNGTSIVDVTDPAHPKYLAFPYPAKPLKSGPLGRYQHLVVV